MRSWRLMMDNLPEILKYGQQGFFCSQVLLLMGLDLQGKSNPELVRSMQALAGGIGFSGHNCGALTGGACLLGYYAGRDAGNDEDDDRLSLMLIDLVDWFTREIGGKYGGIDCDNILSGRKEEYAVRCPVIVQAVFQKCKELLVDYGFDLYGN